MSASYVCSYIVITLFTVILVVSEAWVQRGKSGSIDSLLNEFEEDDLRFNDYENRLEDSFFKYVARTDDYDRNEVPWESGDQPVQVKMSAYLREVIATTIPLKKIYPTYPPIRERKFFKHLHDFW